MMSRCIKCDDKKKDYGNSENFISLLGSNISKYYEDEEILLHDGVLFATHYLQ